MTKRGTKIYSVKRYRITQEFRKAIKESGHSFDEMHRILGFSVKNIYYKNKSVGEEHLGQIRKLLNFTEPLQEIKYNFAENFGRTILKKLPKHIKKNKDFAELIGIMLGDGYIGKNEVNISFDKRNIAYQDYVDRLCKKIFGLKFRRRYAKQRNTAHLYFYSILLVNELQKYGLRIGDKIKNNVGIPNWIKDNEDCSKACPRGLIDTDGCIYRCKREKQTYIGFTNFDRKLFEDFQEATDKLGYHFVKSNSRNKRLYRKEEVVRFINDIKPFKTIGAVV